MKNKNTVNGTLQLKRGIYQIVLNWKTNGTRHQKWISTQLPERGNKRKAETLLKEVVDEYEQKITLNPRELLFGDYLVEWLDIVKPTIQTSTYIGYHNTICNRIVPYFNNLGIKLQDLEPHDIQKFYSIKMNKEGLSANSIHHFHANIRKALEYAVKMKMILSNPAKLVDLPKIQNKRIEFYSYEDLQKLLKLSMNTPLETPIVIAIYYGLRRSEVSALKWSDVDFVNKTISVQSKVTEIFKSGRRVQIEDSELMKNTSSRRTMPLLQQVEFYLKRLKKTQQENENFYGDAYCSKYKDYICRKPDGSLITPTYITDFFRRFIKKNGLKKITFHGLRHSCATMLLNLGFSIKEIQSWLGHSTFSTTADIYAHIEYKNKISIGEKLDKTLSVI